MIIKEDYMKKTTNILLLFAVILPIVLLFWPFAQWNGAVSLILRIIPSLAAQILFCRAGKRGWIKAIPAVITGAMALWGTYLYFTSPHWQNATVTGLVADYVSPFICCAVVLAVYFIKRTNSLSK